MSKAFTKEPEPGADDDDADEIEPAPRGPSYITREGQRRLRDELERLWHGERPKVTADVQAAAAQGDRSENAEYIYGKKRLREIDRRIRFLSKRLDVLRVVEPGAHLASGDVGRVFFGAWVTVEDEDGAEATYRIVGPDEIDLARRHISVASPVAKALLGKREGDTTLVARPKGTVELTVLRVSYADPDDPAAAR
ncbi:MAG TPA: transcription elongation factor GreB [Polyangiaceae bacterium]|nr:transcription elongation factor GreB [Polyangiaceae bacterium]